MNAKVQKWGNSLALRIPAAFAKEAGLREDTPIELTLDGEKLIIQAVGHKRPTLAELLAQVTPENLHGEIDFGPAMGNEAW